METTYNIIKIEDLKNELIRPLTDQSKKGDNGCIATIGGSLEYTGAPYYSAISALKAGSDLSHVFCHTEAAIPIKSYSPELIVHPGFNLISNEDLLNKSERWFKNMNSILIGPGLGREIDTEKIFLKFAKTISLIKSIPLVFDADSVWFWGKLNSENIDVEDKLKLSYINENKNLILTPNFTEFEKICKCLGNDFNKESNEKQKLFMIDLIEKKNNNEILDNNDIVNVNDLNNDNELKNIFINEINLFNKFNNNFILVKKGLVDVITDGKELYIVKKKGSLKRTGGIGDVLAGLINCYCGMLNKRKKEENKENDITHSELIKCCVFGCYVCREASRIAYEKMKYSLTAPDIINELHSVVTTLY